MSSGGYMGRVPWIDLDSAKIEIEDIEERMRRDFIGGYGIGSRIIYERQKPGVDPLSPENILGFFTGPLTGVHGIPAPAADRSAFVWCWLRDWKIAINHTW